jgi:hypothetical protein
VKFREWSKLNSSKLWHLYVIYDIDPPPFISLTLMVFEEYAIDIPQNSRCYRILVHLLPGGPHTL